MIANDIYFFFLPLEGSSVASTSWCLRADPKEVMHGVSHVAKQGYLHSVTEITETGEGLTLLWRLHCLFPLKDGPSR